jgi:hypothetical protein
MDTTTFEDYVANRYVKQMEYYRDAAARNQKKYKLFQWTLIVLSAVTPVLAALSSVSWFQDKNANALGIQFLHILLVVVSSVVAILTTGLKTFQYQELWTIYRSTYEQLKPEKYYYDFGIGPYATSENRESLFVTRVEAMLDKEHANWPPAKKIQGGGDKPEIANQQDK